jgi:excisionase family DNA binding protein
MENFKTVRQVAQQFQVCPLTVRRWYYDGDLRGIKLGGAVRFAESAIQEFVTRSQQRHPVVK